MFNSEVQILYSFGKSINVFVFTNCSIYTMWLYLNHVQILFYSPSTLSCLLSTERGPFPNMTVLPNLKSRLYINIQRVSVFIHTIFIYLFLMFLLWLLLDIVLCIIVCGLNCIFSVHLTYVVFVNMVELISIFHG